MDFAHTSCRPNSAKLALKENVSRLENPFTGGVKFVRLPGSRWRLSLNYDALSPEASRELEASLFGLRSGQAPAFFPDFSYVDKPTQPSALRVKRPAAANATALECQGVCQLRKGDRFALTHAGTGLTFMYMLTQPPVVTTEGFTLEFVPELRRDAPAGTPLLTDDAVGFTGTITDTENMESDKKGMQYALSLTVEETLYAP